jgi:hypothetical protein
LSFALLIIFGFHAKYSAISKCFPKKGRSKIIVLHPPFSRFWKWGICHLYLQPLRHGKDV